MFTAANLHDSYAKSYALASQDSFSMKSQTFPNGTFHRLVARENARFQNYAKCVTGARDVARRRRGSLQTLQQYEGFGAVAVATCRIPCACASDQPSRAMQKLSMNLIARACVSSSNERATEADQSLYSLEFPNARFWRPYR